MTSAPQNVTLTFFFIAEHLKTISFSFNLFMYINFDTNNSVVNGLSLTQLVNVNCLKLGDS